MRYLSIYISVLVLIFTAKLAASPSQNKAEIQQLFADYMAKYNHYLQTGKLHHAPGLYHPQVMLVSEQRVPTVVSEAQLYSQIEVFLDSLKNRGVSNVNWQKVDIHLLSNKMALASNVAIRYNQQGKVVDRVGASYTLSKHDQGWRIAAFAVHPVDNAFVFNPIVVSEDGKLGRLSVVTGSTTKQ